MEESLKSTFEAHHNEIRRRSSLATNPESLNSITFSRVEDDGVDEPFVNPEQAFAVFSLSHAEFAPKPERPDNPALCVYGLFETMVEAHQHAKKVIQAHPEVSVLVDRTHKWIVATSSLAHLGDSEYVEGHTRALLEREEQTKRKNDEEFERIVEVREAGPVSAKTEEAEAPPPASDGDEEKPTAQRFKIASECKLAEQRLVVASFVKDEAELPEFLFMIYAAFEDEGKANRYVRNVCGDHVTRFNIDVVQSAAWVFPQRMDGAKVQKEVYRSDELNRVMQTHKKNPQEVERFMKENESQLKDWDILPEPAAEASSSSAADAAPVEGEELVVE